MKLENINLKLVETRDGFLDVIDLDQISTINRLIDYGVITLKNGLVKCLNLLSTFEIEKLLKERR